MRPRGGQDVRPAEPRTRVNETIRVPQVRLIDDDGSQIGVKARDEALEYAWAKNLDLVEVAPDANPPVCRVMDYGKYRYDQEQKQKLARKHQSTITIKEIKLRPKIDPHDYETKKGHVLRFLKSRDKVKVTIMFRGREMYHPERGRSLLLRLAEDVKDLAMIESDPLQDGRNMVMMLAPHKEAVVAKAADESGDEEGGAASSPPAEADAAETTEVDAAETTEVDAAETTEVDAAETTEIDAAETTEVDAAGTPEVEDEVETPEAASPEPGAEAEAQAETPVTPA